METVRLKLDNEAKTGSRDVVKYNGLILKAASTGNKAMIEVLLGHDINIESQNASGQTPLHLAVMEGNENAVALLFECGAQMDVKERDSSPSLG